jgi:hypothetical protein
MADSNVIVPAEGTIGGPTEIANGPLKAPAQHKIFNVDILLRTRHVATEPECKALVIFTFFKKNSAQPSPIEEDYLWVTEKCHFFGNL